MIIKLKATRASMSRRRELRDKIVSLLQEYDDVPIFVAHKLIFAPSKDDSMFDFTKGQQKRQVHIIYDTTLVGTRIGRNHA